MRKVPVKKGSSEIVESNVKVTIVSITPDGVCVRYLSANSGHLVDGIVASLETLPPELAFIGRSFIGDVVGIDFTTRLPIIRYRSSSATLKPTNKDVSARSRSSEVAISTALPKVGEIIEVYILSLKPYGALFSYQGYQGLLHIRNASWSCSDISALCAVGETLRAKIIEVNHKAKKLSVSIKCFKPDYREEYIANHNVGELVYGLVRRESEWGFWIGLDVEVEALLSYGAINSAIYPGGIQIGEELWLRLSRLNAKKHTIYVSTFDLEDAPLAAEYRDAFGVDTIDGVDDRSDDGMDITSMHTLNVSNLNEGTQWKHTGTQY